jgi:hypothetical protein
MKFLAKGSLAQSFKDLETSPPPGGEVADRRSAGDGASNFRASARVRVVVAAVVWFLPSLAAGQDQRPNEDQLFGAGSGAPTPPAAAPAAPVPSAPIPAAPATPTPPTAAPGGNPEAPLAPLSEPPAAAADPANRDQALLGNSDASPQLSGEVAPENPLTIGGQLYLRTQSIAFQHAYPDRWSLASPNLIDAYFDARPNDRVRAFIRGRVSYDPTAPPSGTPAATGLNQLTMGTSGALTGSSVTGFTTFNASRGPNSVLDQMWIAFDVEHKVFVTAGKQHVKWGTGRFWTPTDYLHPIKRNPLDVFDARPGTTMVKLHFPWEARAWNFYAFGVIEDPNAASNTLRQVAGAGRAELVLGAAELGLDFLVKRDQQPKVGADLSVGVGDFDLYADAGFRAGSEVTIVSQNPAAQPILCADGTVVTDYANAYVTHPASGIKPQVATGVTWSRKYNDNDAFTLGGEYFYNSIGYSDPAIYPGLLAKNQINFFYTGRNYAAVFASLPAPYSWNYTTFTLSTIGNLSDLSFVSRIDYAVTLLTHLTFEAFAAVHYGTLGGEFRLGFDLTTCGPNGNAVTISQPAPLVDLGVALRLKI